MGKLIDLAGKTFGRWTYSLEALEKDSQNLAGASSANLLKAERQKEPMGQQEHGSTGYGRT